jgi:hypothetical protein
MAEAKEPGLASRILICSIVKMYRGSRVSAASVPELSDANEKDSLIVSMSLAACVSVMSERSLHRTDV